MIMIVICLHGQYKPILRSWDSDLDYLGIIKTKDMYANYDKIKIGERKANGVVFDVIGWKECLINGLRMGIYPATLREELK